MLNLFKVNVIWKGHTLISLPFIRLFRRRNLLDYELFWAGDTQPCLASYCGRFHFALEWDGMSLSYPEGVISTFSKIFENPKGSFRLRQCINALVQILLNQVKYPNPMTVDFCIDEYKLSLKDISLIKRLYNKAFFSSMGSMSPIRLSDKRRYYYKGYTEFLSNSYLKSLLSKQLGLQVDIRSFEKVMSERKFMFFLWSLYLFFEDTVTFNLLFQGEGLKLLDQGKGDSIFFYRPYGDFVLEEFFDFFCGHKDVYLDKDLKVRRYGQTFYYGGEGSTADVYRYVARTDLIFLTCCDFIYLWMRRGKDLSVYSKIVFGGYSYFLEGLEFRRLLRKLRKIKRVSSPKGKDK